MKRFQITVNGTPYDVQVEEMDEGMAVPTSPAAQPAPAPSVSIPTPPVTRPAAASAVSAPSSAADAGSETISAPMPGTVLDLLVKAGDTVTKGQVLLILEAMKMENEILSPRDGAVAAVSVTKGESVDSGRVLLTLR